MKFKQLIWIKFLFEVLRYLLFLRVTNDIKTIYYTKKFLYAVFVQLYNYDYVEYYITVIAC